VTYLKKKMIVGVEWKFWEVCYSHYKLEKLILF